MQTYDYDLFVIGAGSGGVRASRIAAGYGARVAVAEEYRTGGTCVIRGCVPKKLLMYASHFAQAVDDAAGFGWRAPTPVHDWASLIAAKNAEIARLEAIYVRMLQSAGVEAITGRAQIVGPHRVEVNGVIFTAKVILVASGSVPVEPAIQGAELMITSNEAFYLDTLPKRIAIIGGGYIACEFAGIFNGLGSDVTQLYRGQQILRGFDDELRNHLGAEVSKSGVDLRVAVDVAAVGKRGDGLVVHLTTGQAIEVDAVMAATGRRSNTSGMGLESAEVLLDESGAIKVDEYSATSNPDIYAVGDVTNRLNLTPVAIHEGHAFADTVFGGRKRASAHDNVPFAVFSQPQAASVGLTEAQARRRHAKVDVYSSAFRPMRTALSGRDERALVKLVVDASTDRVLGAHIVAADAAEIILGIAVAIKAKATKADFDATLGVHPTLAEEFVTLRNRR
ncbi:glutathione-disulfide reductase [Cupriavidus pinatubonensis]|uniref:glutathione-disulfide reductase n=1 Tax=Cupriavidus pinatubonensis TaxID=248026 RepID=UPI00112624B0|nr:glutathione-disulfide reductase [Cupriavidus pinatubonensis]TPQ39138.1 glutathione-disulfide reductase [Cupriavidus pinatubonensis]